VTHLNVETQEELAYLLGQGWVFRGFDAFGWIGTCPGKRDVDKSTLELAVVAAMVEEKKKCEESTK